MKRLALLALLLFATSAHSTVNEVTARNDYVAVGGTTTFAYTFKILEKTQITVLVDGILRTVDTHYSVSGLGDSAGGTVTLFTAPASGVHVSLIRDQPVQQLSIYNANEAFPATRLMTDLDKNIMVDQMQEEELRRALKFGQESFVHDVVVDDPIGSSCLAWNGLGTRVVNVTCGSGGGGGGGGGVPPIATGNIVFGGPSLELSQDLTGHFRYDNVAKSLIVGTLPTGPLAPGNVFLGLAAPSNSTGMQNLMVQTQQGTSPGIGLVTLGDDRVGISSWNFRGTGSTNPIYGANFGVVFSTNGVANGLEIDVQNNSGTANQGQALWLNGSGTTGRANAILIDTQDGSKWNRGILFKEGFVDNGATGSIETIGIHFEQSQDADFIVIQPRLGTLGNVAFKLTDPAFTVNRFELLNNGTVRGTGGLTTAAFPVFSFVDDVDSGMYQEAQNVLGWGVGGLRRLTLGSALNVWNSGAGANQGGNINLFDNTAVHSVGFLAADTINNTWRIRLPAVWGTAGQCVVTNGGTPIETWSYADCAGGSGTGTVTTSGSPASGQVAFFSPSGTVITGEAPFHYDASLNTLLVEGGGFLVTNPVDSGTSAMSAWAQVTGSTGSQNTADFMASTTAQMADTFGPSIRLWAIDVDATPRNYLELSATRSGNDDTGEMKIRTMIAGTMADRITVNATGMTTVVGSGTGVPLTVTDPTTATGTGIKLIGDGGTTPAKTVRARLGEFHVLNDAGTGVILRLTDAGVLTAPNLVSSGVTTTGQAALVLGPFGTSSGETGEARFLERLANGSNYVGFRAPDAIAANIMWTLPAVDSTGTQCLASNGSGVLSWGACSAGSGTGLTSLNGLTGATQTFTNDTNVTITSGGTAHVIGWAGTLSPTRGGTGQNTSSSTGVPNVTAGTWSVLAQLPKSLGGTGGTGGTAGQVGYWTSTTLTGSPTFTWDSAGNALTVNKVTIGDAALTVARALNVTSAAPPTRFERSTAATGVGFGTAQQLVHTTSGQMVDGFDILQTFILRDADGIDNNAAVLRAYRDGADNSSSFAIQTNVAGVLGDRLVINGSGQMFFNPTPTVGTFGLSANGTRTTELLFFTNNGTNAVGLVAPATSTGNFVWKLPQTLGAAGSILTNNGAGDLSWSSPASGQAFCTATTVSDGSTDDSAAVTAAFTAGCHTVMLRRNTRVKTASFAIPNDTTVIGEDATVIIGTGAGFPTLGSRSSVKNLALATPDCPDGAVGCFIALYTNQSPSGTIFSAAHHNAIGLNKGGYSGDQNTGIAVTHNGTGTGDNFYSATIAGTGTAFVDALYRGDLFGGGANASVFMAGIEASAHTSARGIQVNDLRTTGSLGMIALNTSTRTDFGPMIRFVHDSSAFQGSVLEAAMSNGGGTFTGSYIKFTNGGVAKFQVAASGDVYIRGLGGFSGSKILGSCTITVTGGIITGFTGPGTC